MNQSAKKQSKALEFLRLILPIISWLPNYIRAWLRADIMVGLAIWAIAVPQALSQCQEQI
jgi:MFS superfamily sulfate permease-like transporter